MFHEKTFKEVFINNDEYYVLDEMQEPFIIAVSTPLMTKIENSFVDNEVTESLIVPLYDSEIFDGSPKSKILSIKKKKENVNKEFESKENESKKMVDKCVNTDLTIEMMNKLIKKKKMKFCCVVM